MTREQKSELKQRIAAAGNNPTRSNYDLSTSTTTKANSPRTVALGASVLPIPDSVESSGDQSITTRIDRYISDQLGNKASSFQGVTSAAKTWGARIAKGTNEKGMSYRGPRPGTLVHDTYRPLKLKRVSNGEISYWMVVTPKANTAKRTPAVSRTVSAIPSETVNTQVQLKHSVEYYQEIARANLLTFGDAFEVINGQSISRPNPSTLSGQLTFTMVYRNCREREQDQLQSERYLAQPRPYENNANRRGIFTLETITKVFKARTHRSRIGQLTPRFVTPVRPPLARTSENFA